MVHIVAYCVDAEDGSIYPSWVVRDCATAGSDLGSSPSPVIQNLYRVVNRADAEQDRAVLHTRTGSCAGPANCLTSRLRPKAST
jgi:hypothetical protein